MLEKFGYVIPDPQMRVRGDEGFNPNGETPRPFYRKVMESNDTSELSEKLDHILAKDEFSDKTFLLSAENLVNQLRKPPGYNIHKVLKEYFSEVKVLYYIKPFDEFLLSAWQQWGYKKGKSFEGFVDEAVKVNNPSFRIAADFFSKTYGKENLSISVVKKDFLRNGSLLEDFFYKLGVPSDSLSLMSSESNVSLSPALCDLLSYCPSLFKDIHDESVKKLLSSYLGRDSLIFERMPGFVSKEVSDKISQSFGNDAKLLCNNYMRNAGPNDLLSSSSITSEEGYDEVKMLKRQMAVQTELLISLMKEGRSQ
ncbi:hypothetical protein QWY79_15175 [Halomonas sabkhae]|uniref:hypothetical protein n=1 Tax=Halomonas sabkhae TaxID=626223 RepID=UPI0025B488DE|nr:hypothetical protein [Halomonas sabkhae]MDN3526612.1 hypothetical protein [Halomonas sabkhae]